MSSNFRDFFNNLLLEEQNKIIDMVDKGAKAQYTKMQLKSPKSSKTKSQKVSKPSVVNTVNIYEIPDTIRTYGIKIKHTKLLDDEVEIELFDLDDVDNALKILKKLGIKSYKFNNLVITIKG